MKKRLLDLIDLGNENNYKSNFEIEKYSSRDIAIVGMAVRMPMAEDVGEFWNNIRNGADCVSHFPENRRKAMDKYVSRTMNIDKENIEYAHAAYLEDIDKFDYTFFNMSPREASLTDPKQRLLLETVWQTFEDAGYAMESLKGRNIGVFVGYRADEIYDYRRYISEIAPSSMAVSTAGNLVSIIASRISYIFDFHGPSIVIDSACSSSLTAIHTACRSIRNGECEQAIAGSVTINMLPLKIEQKLGIESSDARTKTFDDDSDGTGMGEGVAAILLKPLNKAIEDEDHIHAVIKGSAVNQDGKSIGITAPNAIAQEEVIVKAWEDAGINPEDISYIEAHGTGTSLGDPIEIDGIRRAFRKYTGKSQFCGIGSVKTNIGHLDNAAGIAGLVKTVMALEHKELPPSIHFNRPNRKIEFEDCPVYVNDILKSWQTDRLPRRCGISSFGMSGTNCHVVLEEGPITRGEKNKEENGLQIMTISAKSEYSLRALIKKYRQFAEKDERPDLGDICYTANTGRDHYNFRIAMLLKDGEDFREKIRKLDTEGLGSVDNHGIFYGRHAAVRNDRVLTEEWEITEDTARALEAAAGRKLKELMGTEKENTEVLKEICSLYIAGAQVEWASLYKGKRVKRVSLPVYQFQHFSCWLDVEPSGTESFKSYRKVDYPLLDGFVIDSIDQDIYIDEVGVEKYWVLSEHKVIGKHVLVGTAYLEMALECCKKYFSHGGIELRDIILLSPFFVKKGERRELQVAIKKERNNYSFTIASRPASDDRGETQKWTRHAEGNVCGLKGSRPQSYDLDLLKKRCSKKHILFDEELIMNIPEFQLGPRWKNVLGVYCGENEYLKEIQIPGKFKDELQEYVLHPSLLDMAVNNAFAMNAQDEGVFLPLSYKRLQIFAPMPQGFYSYIIGKEGPGGNTGIKSFDIYLMDEGGNVFASIEDYSIRRVEEGQIAHAQRAEEKDLYFEVLWKPSTVTGQRKLAPEAGVLIFKDEKGLAPELADKLKNETKRVILAGIGGEYKKISDDEYLIRAAEEDFTRLFKDISDINLQQVIHMSTLSENKDAACPEELEEAQRKGAYSLFYMARAILSNHYEQDISLLLVSEFVNEVTGQEEIIKPENATLFGFGRVISQEYPKLRVSCLDGDGSLTADGIISELKAEKDIYQVAYRKGQRYGDEINSMDISQKEPKGIEVRRNGVYIVTGGTGGIGLEICKYLASRNNVRLMLINRTGMPARSQWEKILNTAEDISICEKIKKIREIEATGTIVESYSADLSKIGELKNVFDEIRRKYGKISGIVHGAGIPGSGFIIKKEEESFKEVLLPKVNGTWNLDYITSEENLDFFVMFSSIIALTGGVGQADYAAANSYQDSFSIYRNKRGKRTLTINWTAWKETGMAVRHGVNSDSILKAISTKDAVEAFDAVLNKDIQRIIIGQLNAGFHAKKPGGPEPEWRDSESDFKIKGKKDGRYTEVERKVARIWKKVLGFEEINIYDDFFAIGGDSILLSQVHQEIDNEFPGKASIADLFAYPSIYKLSTFIIEAGGKQEAKDQAKVEDKETLEQDLFDMFDKIEKGDMDIEQAFESLKNV